jgi:ATP-binding cassette subfamily B protein
VNPNTAVAEEQFGAVRDWVLMGRLLALLRPYWKLVSASVACAVADMGLQILGPLVVSIAVDRYFIGQARFPIVLDRWIPLDRSRGLGLLSMAYLGVLVLACLAQAFQSYLAAWSGERAMADLRQRVFAHLQELDIAFFDTNPVGRLVTRVTTDVEALSEMFSGGIVGVMASLVMTVFFLACMMAMSKQLTLTVGVALPVFVGMTVIFRRVVTPTQQRVRILIARINAMVAEHISGIAVLQLFNRQEASSREFDHLNREHMLASKGWVTANSWFLPAVELMGTISQAGLILVGGYLLSGGRLTVGILAAFLQYGTRFLRPIQDLSERYGILQTSIVSAERVFRLLDTPAPRRDAVAKLARATDIEFDHVWFAYQGENWVLRDVSFRVETGQSVAVVGHTGAGKTTLISLLLRFYEPQRGSIRVGGVEIRQLDKAELRRMFGVVLQDTYVHEGTILDNIHFGMELDGDAAARSAAANVNFEELAGALPEGLESPVAERGDNLSAGQRQLVGFARALCRNPKLLILDEATSDIDVETEARIQQALAGLLEGRTSVIIAHRLTTVLRADRILVMHRGEVREFGAHRDLLGLRGLYWRLYQLQFGGAVEEEAQALSSLGF